MVLAENAKVISNFIIREGLSQGWGPCMVFTFALRLLFEKLIAALWIKETILAELVLIVTHLALGCSVVCILNRLFITVALPLLNSVSYLCWISLFQCANYLAQLTIGHWWLFTRIVLFGTVPVHIYLLKWTLLLLIVHGCACVLISVCPLSNHSHGRRPLNNSMNLALSDFFGVMLLSRTVFGINVL